MSAILPITIFTTTVMPRQRAYVVLCHVIEFVISRFGYCASFRQSPTFRADRACSLITIVVHVGGGAGSGSSVGVVDTVGAIG